MYCQLPLEEETEDPEGLNINGGRAAGQGCGPGSRMPGPGPSSVIRLRQGCGGTHLAGAGVCYVSQPADFRRHRTWGRGLNTPIRLLFAVYLCLWGTGKGLQSRCLVRLELPVLCTAKPWPSGWRPQPCVLWVLQGLQTGHLFVSAKNGNVYVRVCV